MVDTDTPIEISSPGRVALVVNAFPTVSQTFIVHQFLQMIERGWDLHVLTLRRGDPAWGFYPRLRDDPALRERIHLATDLDQSISRLQPDLVHFEFGNLAVGHLAALHRRNIRSVVSFRGFDAAHWELNTPGFYDEVWQHADALHCISQGVWQRCLMRGCPPEKKKTIIYPGIDPAFFQANKRKRAAVVGTPDRPLQILSVGRLVWKKGHEYTIYALAELLEQGVNAELTIVGQGDHEYALQYEAFDIGVFDRLHLVGAAARDQVRRYMERADVFVFPSMSEGFGNAALEAQAMQLPVVGANVDGIQENVLDGETGFIVPRRDSHHMTQRLAQLAGDPELRVRMGRAGRKRVIENFTIDRQINGFESLYTQTIHRKYAARELMVDTQVRSLDSEPDSTARAKLEAELLQRLPAIPL